MSMNSLLELQPEMNVYTVDAMPVGKVKQIREHDILIDRPYARDVYIPFTYVADVFVSEQRVELNLTKEEYDEHDWEFPEIL